ncbi:hypothetical protein NEOKW01_1300 [Nematocida sp. AWRm80]|nr:hypothetical protein NEOKW01_1300 [Nematocida sp. AWRm80]
MNRERYSRQIRLFGEETQMRIRDTHVNIVNRIQPDTLSEDMLRKMNRHITQIGGTLCSGCNVCTGTEKNNWSFVLLNRKGITEAPKIDKNVFYIDLDTLSITDTKEKMVVLPDRTTIHPFTAPEYHSLVDYFRNIVIAVAVQEYLKVLSCDPNAISSWSFDISGFFPDK